MGLEERLMEQYNEKDETDQTGTICVHAFSDLSYIPPVVFLYLLKECYIHGMIFPPIITNFIEILSSSGPYIVFLLYIFFLLGSTCIVLLTLTDCLDGWNKEESNGKGMVRAIKRYLKRKDCNGKSSS